MERMDQDIQQLLALAKRRHPASQVTAANVTIEHRRRAKFVDPGAAGHETGQRHSEHTRHVAKFLECGHECLQKVARYYKEDFEVFDFPRP